MLGEDGILNVMSTCMGATAWAVVIAAGDEWDDALRGRETSHEAEESQRFEVSSLINANIAQASFNRYTARA